MITKVPEYPRIPYLIPHDSMTTDDECDPELGNKLYNEYVYIEEKMDGANIRICWNGVDEPIVGNRTHILRKGYLKDTNAKLQFRPLWNWLYDNAAKFKELSRIFKDYLGEEHTPILYGEWLWAKHTIGYDKLPDWVIAYDLRYSKTIGIDSGFVSCQLSRNILNDAGFSTPHIIEARHFNLSSAKNIVYANNSYYSNELIEGIIIRTDRNFRAKIVRPSFMPRKDFNDGELIKNCLRK